MATLSVRLPNSIHDAVKSFAREDDVSMFLIFSVDFTCDAGLKNLEDVIQYFHKGKGKTIEE